MSAVGLVALSLAAAAPAGASLRDVRQFDIPAGPLSRSLVVLGKQAGVSIGVFGQPVGNIRARQIKGRYSLADALALLLRGTGYAYRILPGGQIVVVRAKAPPPLRPKPAPPTVRREPQKPDVIQDETEIIVTGSKRGTPLKDYPAAVVVVDVDPRSGSVSLTDGANAIVNKVPVLASTYAGPGRDKLFIQGIADSSYIGYSTSTVAQYLGDVRLTYNSPDPHLTLYDIKHVEILEGPQATLYGAGALGGIVRIVPNDPHSGRTEASFALGVTDTRHGSTGVDAAAMVNLPLATDRAAIRVVAYRQVEPGYIDDSLRRLRDVNQVNIAGGRVAVRIEPDDDWQIDFGGLLQSVDGRDSQYAVRGQPPLTQTARRAQPYSDDFALAHLVVRKEAGAVTLTSATSVSRDESRETFNGAKFENDAITSAINRASDVSITANETRISGSHGRVEFVGGLSFVDFHGEHSYDELLDPEDRPEAFDGASRVIIDIKDMSVFGEVEIPLARTLSATVGARADYMRSRMFRREVIRLDGTAFDTIEARNAQSDVQFLPSVALSWKVSPMLLAFARYQRGFRPGGFRPDLAGPDDRSTAEGDLLLRTVPGDRIGSAQMGFRYGSGAGPFAANVTIFHTRWKDIQGDYLSITGVPAPSAVGDATIFGVEAGTTIRPTKPLAIEAAIFANKVKSPISEIGRSVPSIPDIGASLSASYRIAPFTGGDLTLHGLVRYTGKSRSERLDDDHPASTIINLGARLGLGAYGFTLDITNVGDHRGNRFLLANLHDDTRTFQSTPFRPRSIRLGIDAAF